VLVTVVGGSRSQGTEYHVMSLGRKPRKRIFRVRARDILKWTSVRRVGLRDKSDLVGSKKHWVFFSFYFSYSKLLVVSTKVLILKSAFLQ